jgi:hypothetical protein
MSVGVECVLAFLTGQGVPADVIGHRLAQTQYGQFVVESLRLG